MAYALDGRGPLDQMRRDEGRPGWGPPPYHASAYNHRPPSSMISLELMDPEESGSDVSVGGSDTYMTGNPAQPAPPGPPRQMLESVDAIQARLGELNHVEDSNARKQKSLGEKRGRMDERFRRRREAQDRKINAIYDARKRHDDRISRRRAEEDARFRHIDEQIEEEESNLRRRLKRLKRGLPLDESPHQAGRSISTSSMSPPASFSTVPPPAKRHQTGPPSHNDIVHPPPQGNAHQPQPNASSAPSYSFYQANQKPYPVPYHPSSNYSTVPPPQSATPPHPLPSQSSHPPTNDRSPYATNGRPASPVARPPVINSAPQHEPSPAQSRQLSSSYDTRPPPPPSGFASINAPTHTGFAAVNARSAATPPSAYSSISRPVPDTHTPNAAFPDAQNEPQRYGSNGNGSNSASSTPAAGAGGKRTPSTTHPYQMSEAFANRHHHCERVDSLKRGIWTYHGPNLGTADHPTGPPIEMYLRCNHDNCRRIDWRTVHGLQCHIVKNHEQPKGTIGSLEKALDRYGVPISEVKEYEREHGEGTGGTMADPKNLKIKNKLREGGRKSAPGPAPGSWGLEPTARPAGYKPSPGPDGSAGKMNVEKDMGDFVARRSAGYVEDVNAYSGTAVSEPKSRFEAARGDWNNSTPSRPSPPVDANRQLQGDAVMRDRESPAPPPPKDVAPESRQWTTANFRPYEPPSRHVSIPQSSNVTPNVPAHVNASSVHQPASRAEEIRPPSRASDVTTEGAQKPDERGQTSAVQTITGPPHTRAEDTPMKDVAETSHLATAASEIRNETRPAHDAVLPKDAGDRRNNKPAASEEVKDAMDVDSKEAEAPSRRTESEFKEPPTPVEGPSRGTRSALQSPIVSNKPLNAPGSIKRSIRRASAARRYSGDESIDGHPPAPSSNANDIDGEKGGSTRGTDDGEGHDGESITVASLKRQKDEDMRDEAQRTPPRRNANGRFTRRRTGG